MMAARLLTLFLATCTLAVAVDRVDDGSSVKGSNTLEIRMPGASVSKADAHLCHSMHFDKNEPIFITGFGPLAHSSMAHHAAVTACNKPGRDDDIWNCGDIDEKGYSNGPVCAQDRLPITLYSWTVDIGAFQYPQGVAFPVGGDSGYGAIVLRLHYKQSNATFVDRGGIPVFLTKTKPAKLMGALILATNGKFQPGKLEQCESVCSSPVPATEKLHIFAYRVHTHGLGLMVSGYRVRNGTWTEIGRRSPQLPQDYIPTDIVISSDDYVATRCTMFNFKSSVVSTGERHEDEMCVLYAYYYTENGSFLPELLCSGSGPPKYYWKLDKRINFSEDGPDAQPRPK